MSKRTIIISRTIVMLVLISIQILTVNAQKDMGAGYCSLHGNYTGASCPRCSSGGGTPSNNTRYTRKQQRLDEKQQRLDEAQAANHQGVKYWGDWEKAIPFFEEAVRKNPDDPIMQDNLKKAKEQLQFQQQAQLWNQQQAQLQIQQNKDKDAVVKMQQSVQTFTQTLNTVSSTGGLNFDGQNATTSPGNNNNGSGLAFMPTTTVPVQTTTTGLQFGDPNVVDARVPSDLPKATDDAITGAYKNSPPGVSESVRKGFQAVMAKDWKAAKALFQDALLHDPGNQGLQKFIELCDYTAGNKPAANISNNKQPAMVPGPNTPGKVEIDDFFNNFNAGIAFTPSEKVRKYVLSMTKEEFKKQLDLHLTIKQINELMFENLIKEVEQDIPGNKKPQ